MSRFQKGQSGNPNGRPKGAKSRAMTDKQLKEYLAKRTETCIDEIMKIVTASNDNKGITPNIRLKAANAIINYDFTIRASEYKKTIDKIRFNKNSNDNPEKDDNETTAVVVSLSAVDK